MAYLVKMKDKEFTTKKAAKKFLLEIKNNLIENNQTITEGNLFDLLKDVYERYCEATDYPIKGPMTAFSVVAVPDGKGNSGWTTQALCVVFDNDNENPQEFSINKAVDAIAIKI